ncbi:MAG: hypothetical protein AB7O97_19310 [Planctomycetota bacterium]
MARAVAALAACLALQGCYLSKLLWRGYGAPTGEAERLKADYEVDRLGVVGDGDALALHAIQRGGAVAARLQAMCGTDVWLLLEAAIDDDADPAATAALARWRAGEAPAQVTLEVLARSVQPGETWDLQLVLTPVDAAAGLETCALVSSWRATPVPAFVQAGLELLPPAPRMRLLVCSDELHVHDGHTFAETAIRVFATPFAVTVDLMCLIFIGVIDAALEDDEDDARPGQRPSR